MISRKYYTGVAKVFKASGNLTLGYAGGTFVSGAAELLCATAYSNGFLGGDFFHPWQQRCVGTFGGGQFHGVMSEAWGVGGAIATQFDSGASPPQMRTEIWIGLVSGSIAPLAPPGGSHLLHKWEADVGGAPLAEMPPPVLSLNWTAQFSAELWAYETDSAAIEGASTATGIRPTNAYDARLILAWKVVSDVSVVGSGSASGSVTLPKGDVFSEVLDGDTVLQLREDASYSALATYYEPIPPGGNPMEGDPDGMPPGAGGLGDLPYPCTYADVTNMALDGPIPDWTKVHFESGAGGSTTETLTDQSAFAAHATTAPEGYTSMQGQHKWGVGINGVVEDFNTLLHGVPVTFHGAGSDPPVTRSFTGTETINQQPGVPVVAPPAPYSAADTACARLAYGVTYDALNLAHVSSLEVEDFQTLGGVNGINGSDLSAGPTLVAGKLVATGAASGAPKLSKTLKSDFEDLFVDPTGWWAAHGGSLSSDRQAWWADTGNPASSPHKGDWYRVGCRLLPASDVFNWSGYRYLDVTGKADTACTATLTLHWDEIVFTQDPSTWVVTLTRTAKSAAFPIALTTTNAAHRLDLPSRCGMFGLRYVQSWSLAFPVNRTVTMDQMSLARVASPLVNVHHPSLDASFLSVRVDDKPGLFLSPRQAGAPNSLWGWPCKTLVHQVIDGAAGNVWRSHKMVDLATEIGLQEGFGSSEGSAPDHSTPNYAAFLAEASNRSISASLQGRRSFGGVQVSPKAGQTLDLLIRLGSAGRVLTYDPDTLEPVAVPIEADQGGGTVDAALTSSSGAGHLEVPGEGAVTFYASKGTAQESSGGGTPSDRTIWYLTLTGRGVPGAGGIGYDRDRLNNGWRVRVDGAGVIQLGRQWSADAAWTEFPVGAGSEPDIKVEETHPGYRVWVVYRQGADSIQAAYSEELGEGGWHLTTIGTGSNPSILLLKAHNLKLYSYWRNVSGGTIFVKRYDANGALESEIAAVTGIAECKAPMDVRAEGTLEMLYPSGGSILSVTSADNGHTWA